MMKEENTNTDVIMQDIIDGQNDKIRSLNDRIVCLQDQLKTAYGVNNGLQQELEEEKKYKNLVNLNTLLLVIMGLTQPFCAGSDYGSFVAKAIKDFYIAEAEILDRHIDYGLGDM